MTITPPNFDPHAYDIDSPRLAWSDLDISRLDVLENRQWVRDAVARSRTLPPVVETPAPPRKTHRALLWVPPVLILLIAGVLAAVVAVTR